MSDIKFACIHCGQKLSCEQALTGQRISCPACQRSVLVPWAPAASEPPKTSGASVIESFSSASRNPIELPNVSIPELSVPDIEASSVRPPPKMLQLQGRNRAAPGLSILAVLSFTLSLLGLLGFLPAITLLGSLGFLPAIICGHIAKWQMRRNAALRGESLATAGLAIAYTSALLTGVFVARSLLRRL